MSGIAHSETVVMERFEPLAIEAPLALASSLPQEFSSLPQEFTLPSVLTLQRLLSLSLTERQQVIAGCLPGIIADFESYPELRDFSSDSSDWELGDD